MQHTTKKNTYSIRKNMEHHRTIEPYVHHCIPTISAYRRKNTHTKKKKTREKEKQPDNAVYLHYTIATKKKQDPFSPSKIPHGEARHGCSFRCFRALRRPRSWCRSSSYRQSATKRRGAKVSRGSDCSLSAPGKQRKMRGSNGKKKSTKLRIEHDLRQFHE